MFKRAERMRVLDIERGLAQNKPGLLLLKAGGVGCAGGPGPALGGNGKSEAHGHLPERGVNKQFTWGAADPV